MKNLKVLFEEIREVKYDTTKDSIQQTQRNNLRKQIIDAFSQDMSDLGLEMFRTGDGTVTIAENTELGAIPIIFSVTLPMLSYDYESEQEEYLAKEEEKIAKAKAKAEKTAKANTERKSQKEKEKGE